MGEAFIPRKNNANGVGSSFAIIGVTYPSGSTCTCTNGNVVLTDENTNGQVIFNVPSTGTWTVTATDGTETANQSVNITTEGQFESVTLQYRIYIYEQGVTEIVFATSWGDKPADNVDENVWIASNSGSLKQVDGVLVDDDITSSTDHRINRAKKVDLTDVDTIFYELRFIDDDGYNYTKVGVSNSWPYWGGVTFAAQASPELHIEKQTVALDVTSLTGEYWVFVYFGSLKGHELYNIWY